MISLIPCYSLEDFSLYRKSSEVDEIFSAWSALYHPALVARFGVAPRWEAAGSPSTGKERRLVVVPPCAEYLVSRSWLKSAEEEGAIIIRNVADRDDILKTIFEKLEINGSENDDAAESFLAVGLCCLLEELLTRKLRYMSNLDLVSFNSRIVDAARAHLSGDEEEREKNLQKAFDLLATSKEYFFPTATKFLDLTKPLEEDLAEALPNELKKRRQRDAKTNLFLPAPLLRKCEKHFPETLCLLREEIAAKRVFLVGGDSLEAPLYLMDPLEIARLLLDGRNEYLRALGTPPSAFGRQEQGYAQILPQLLKLTGYRGALSRTGDGWSLLEKSTDRSRFLWKGRDGSTIATLCKKTLDAANSEDLLQLPDKIGNSYYSEDADAVVFEHRPFAESRWLDDLLRMDKYSPVLGKFYDIDEYFRVTEGLGKKEKFVKDNFKTNFLTRSAKRNRDDLVSSWVKRRRLGEIESVFKGLETSLRAFTVKAKRSSKLDDLFDAYLTSSNELIQKASQSLERINEALLPVESNSPTSTPDLDSLFEELEREKDATLALASKFLAEAFLNASESDLVDDSNLGFLFFNGTGSRKTARWEIRGSRDALDLFARDLAEYETDVWEAPVDSSTFVAQYRAELNPGELFWIPKSDDVEYRFHNRPLFDSSGFSTPSFTEEISIAPNAENETTSNKSPGFLKRIAEKLRGDVPNSVNCAEGSRSSKKTLAEFVVKKYSASEIEKYYRLRNDFFELRIDPISGAVRRLTTYESAATFHNGVLRQPNMGNRLAWDVAFKIPSDSLDDDPRSPDDSGYGYSISAADSIDILASEPSVGRVRISGRMVLPSGELAGRFVQILTARLRDRIIEVELELEPRLEPGDSPWDSYYCCRAAWKDALADVRGGASASLIGTARDYLQAPECVDIRSEESIGLTILSAGLPYFKKTADARIDAILVPKGETSRKFRFAFGVDLERPHLDALAFLAPDPLRLDDVPRPKRKSRELFSSNLANVQIREIYPILERKADEKSPVFVGAKLVVLETSGAVSNVAIRSFLPIERVESLNLLGEVKRDAIKTSNANSIEIKFEPRQLRIFNVFFRASSLK